MTDQNAHSTEGPDRAPDGLPIYELGDPEAPYGFSAAGGGYLIVRPPGEDCIA
jgi:hypothetical protein